MRYTQDQMEASVNAWKNSGLSKKAFCRDRAITYPTFHYWCKRVEMAGPTGFAEVGVTHNPCNDMFELVFPSGARMIFKSQPSAGWLRELVG